MKQEVGRGRWTDSAAGFLFSAEGHFRFCSATARKLSYIVAPAPNHTSPLRAPGRRTPRLYVRIKGRCPASSHCPVVAIAHRHS